MPDTTVKLQDITPVKSTFDNDDQLLLINPTGEARISKEDFLDAMPDDAITLIGDITTTGIEGDTVAKQLGALENSKAPAITETTESSAIANFTDGADDMVMHHVVAEINPVQSGSGDPSPDNIRPITGWTGCNVTRTGKNELIYPFTQNSVSVNGVTATANSDGTVTVSGTCTASGSYMWLYGSSATSLMSTLKEGETYTYSLEGAVSGLNGQVLFYGSPSVVYTVFGVNTAPSVTFTVPDMSGYNGFAVVLAFVNGVTYNNVTVKPMIRLASDSDTTYETYQSNTVTVDWTTEAGTVYGGTIDVATGLLTVTDGYIASYNGEALPSTWISDRDVYASGTTPTTGAQVVYALTTAQTYQLTGQQLKTLYGTNNVWADTGNVSVTYPADTKMFIEKLTMPTEDDLVANQAITSGKYFMIGNSLYLALANIASGAQITIGTNAQRVSLADALNTINS